MRKQVRERASNVFLIAVLFPLVINAPALLDIIKADPAVFYSTIATNVRHGILPGLPLIDPSVGFIFQSLGKRAAQEILSGHVPWWNPFEGVGSPLAGEMNVGAFFPLTLLLVFPRGQIFTQVVVQMLAGVGTLLFLRRLGLQRAAALTAALLFEINGTMAWLASGWSYSQAFLPFLLYGVELLRTVEKRTQLIGSVTVALAVALSIASGFIEIAYLNGLLAVGWCGLRLLQTPRRAQLAFAAALVGSGIAGALLAAPVIVAFFDYLHVAYVGPHNGEAFTHAVLPPLAFAQKLLPYIYGPIFGFGPVSLVWGSTGGYAMLGVSVIALTALGGRTLQAERLYFAAWIVLTLGATFGLPIVHAFVLHWPGVRFTAQYRYFDSSWEFALCVLAAFTVSDVARGAAPRAATRAALAVLALGAACVASLLSSVDVLRALWVQPQYRPWFIGSTMFAVSIVGAVLFALSSGSAAQRARRLAIVALVEAAVCYSVPMLSAPTAATINTAGVEFLQRNIGYGRLYTMGPVFPNYGSYFGVASINYNDIPMAQNWVSYVLAHLDPYIEPLLFLGTRPGPEVNVPSREDVLHENLAGFKAVGVKYVLTFPQARRLFETAFEPPVGTGPQSAQSLLHAVVDIGLPALPPGNVSGIQILQGNYQHTADGSLHVRFCVRAVCVTGQRPLSESTDNAYFAIPFRHPIGVDGSPAIVRLEQRGAAVPDALWEWGASSPLSVSVAVNGKAQPGQGAHINVVYSSQPVDLPVKPGGNQAYDFAPGKHARVTLGRIARDGVIDGLGVLVGTNGHTADGTLRVRACSANRCALGERPLQASADNDFAWLHLTQNLRVSGHTLSVDVEHRGGRKSAAIWLWPLDAANPEQTTIGTAAIADRGPRLRLNYVDAVENPATLVYEDPTMNVYALKGTQPYFTAPGCTLEATSRTRVAADCRRPSRLVRLELSMPGWSARIDGRSTPLRTSGEIFESVDVPAGHSVVEFSFAPAFMSYAYAACCLGLAAIVIQTWLLLFALRPKLAQRQALAR